MTVQPTATRSEADACADQLSEAVLRLHDILDGASHLLVVTDENDVVSYASERSQTLFGLPPEFLMGRLLTDLLEPGDRDRVSNVAQQVRAGRAEGHSTVGFATTAGSSPARLLEADLARLAGQSTPGSLVWAIRGLGTRRALGPETDRAVHDDLTGLPNRAMLLEHLALALSRHQRAHTRLATILVGIDGFVSAWEDDGHRAAHDMLLSTADRLTSVARPGDLVARVGVDEFALVLDGVSSDAEVLSLTEDALTSLSVPVDANGRLLALDARAGAALSSDETTSALTLIDQAGVAVDRARKGPAPRRALFHPSMPADPARGSDLLSDLQEAIQNGEIRSVYQPIVDLGSGRLCGFEALARWDHPDRGAIPPAVFITLAEQSGLIVELGRHMLVLACQQAEIWRRAVPDDPLRMGVNASPRQLVGRTVVDDVRRALKFSQLPPDHLVLEITESGLHRDLAGVRGLLGQLRDLGVRTAMDDFGTGFSSLAYLRRLPLDIVKIDKSFIDDRDGSGPRFLAAIVGLGQQLGLDTLAEGIEDAEQYETARAAGCSFGQGFLMSRPLEVDDASRLVGLSEPVWAPTPTQTTPTPMERVSAS